MCATGKERPPLKVRPAKNGSTVGGRGGKESGKEVGGRGTKGGIRPQHTEPRSACAAHAGGRRLRRFPSSGGVLSFRLRRQLSWQNLQPTADSDYHLKGVWATHASRARHRPSKARRKLSTVPSPRPSQSEAFVGSFVDRSRVSICHLEAQVQAEAKTRWSPAQIRQRYIEVSGSRVWQRWALQPMRKIKPKSKLCGPGPGDANSCCHRTRALHE